MCWQTVGLPSANGNIAEHFDSEGRDVCPMSGEPFTLAGHGRRRWALEREYVQPLADEPEFTALDAVSVLRMDRLERLVGL